MVEGTAGAAPIGPGATPMGAGAALTTGAGTPHDEQPLLGTPNATAPQDPPAQLPQLLHEPQEPRHGLQPQGLHPHGLPQ